MNPPYHEMSPMRVLLKITRSEPPGLELPHKWYIHTCMCVCAVYIVQQIHVCVHVGLELSVFVLILYLPRSKEFNNFLAKCLTKNPESRDSASELLQHPFLSSVTDHKPLRALYQVTREIMHDLYQCCLRPNMLK